MYWTADAVTRCEGGWEEFSENNLQFIYLDLDLALVVLVDRLVLAICLDQKECAEATRTS